MIQNGKQPMHIDPMQLQQAIKATYEEIGPDAFDISPVALMCLHEGAVEAITYGATEEKVDVNAIMNHAISYANEIATDNHICITCEFMGEDEDVSKAQKLSQFRLTL